MAQLDLATWQVPQERVVARTAVQVGNLPTPLYIAHRGGGSLQASYQGPFPEESLEAFRASRALGTVQALNPHAAMLSDRALVCMHDNAPDRTTNVAALGLPAGVSLASYNSGAWRRLKLTPTNTTLWPGYGVDWGEMHPPFLAEYLDQNGPHVCHVIECSAHGWQSAGTVGTAVVAEIVARGLQRNTIIQSFNVNELTPAAAAGITAMYLPPDLGVAGSDAASIAAAMVNGWAAGTDKWVGINAFPGGQTQAQVVTYIGTLIAAGFKVAAWTIVRRYDRDWLLAAGVSGLIVDEPLYTPTNTASAVNGAGVSSMAAGVAPHGWLPADQGNGRGALVGGGIQLDYVTAARNQFIVLGEFCPVANPSACTVQADFVWDQFDTSTTRWVSLLVCAPDDRACSMVIGSGNGVIDCYQVLFRQDGSNLTVARGDRAGQTITNVTGGVISTGLPPAPSGVGVGCVTTMKVQVTATTLVVTLIQNSVTYGPWTFTDSVVARGGYFHAGKSTSGTTKLVATVKNVSVT